jgi:hypothetical protein
MLEDAELGRLAGAASRLLLNAPNARELDALREQTGQVLELARARQDFYDFLCVPQSGCFLPPYAHVLAAARETDEFWHFPQARFDGGDILMPWYDAVAFHPAQLQADPMLGAANRPLDHVGVTLAFLALLLNSASHDEADREVIGEFISLHVQPWSEVFVRLLTQSGSGYLFLVGEAIGDLMEALRAAHPPGAVAHKEREPVWIPILQTPDGGAAAQPHSGVQGAGRAGGAA